MTHTPVRRAIVEADGGSRGNPGPAGFGAVVRDPETSEVLAERSGGLGTTTNNVAEYEGLIAGLEAALELGVREVEARLDSKLVVEQMSGRWSVKHANLKPLALKAQKLVRQFEGVHFEWIPRARNAHADRLANEAMDTQAGESTTAGPAEQQREQSKPVETQRSARLPAWNGATGTATRFLLVRHGQTALSVERRYSGRGDVPLTELGQQQAAAVARRLAGLEGVAGAPVVTSPLKRAQQTAEAIAVATGGEVRPHDGLLETDFGEWEGLTFREAAEQYPELHRSWLGDPCVPPPNGESMDAVFRRVRATRDQLVEQYAGNTLVLVSHVTPIKCLLRLGLDVGPSLFYRLHLDLASLSVLDFYLDGNASVSLVNDTSHLV